MSEILERTSDYILLEEGKQTSLHFRVEGREGRNKSKSDLRNDLRVMTLNMEEELSDIQSQCL
jgi:hypothetical protein